MTAFLIVSSNPPTSKIEIDHKQPKHFLLLLTGVFNYFAIKESPMSVGLPNLNEIELKESACLPRENPLDKLNWSSAVMHMLRDRTVWLMLLFVGGTTVLMEVQSFLPLFLRQYLKLDMGSAVYASCSFQIGSIGGVIFGGYLYDKLAAKKLTMFLNLCMIVCTGCYIFYWRMLPVMSKVDVFYTLFVIGFFLSIPYYLPASVFSMVYGGQRFSGTLAALLESLGFLLTMTFDYYAAVVVKEHGWSTFFGILAVASMGTTAIFFLVSSHPTLITRRH
ncbi:uncharacterized protein TRIADDRAFT_54689 [Trichoplax adhaerens]|uniref:Major facilitator superfamily (MFS) profile domain-containing protein n=1 Tax=Trichoplax adhaerens TaxID=10228 RepID=B3RSQ3_TRIAD|nr:hypothetical protein TRIADDRAFT_54689 [Trichoplax adhaerens]EDV27093.1 hypothetical protein TRIADDRAFT_54689 [Trichoplax adhaerens]|eukprot:XP_002111089.1 hypothetical protein TRIADDRAFT_54689 [Trichoplax adhaerens]